MQITVTGRHLDVGASLRRHVEDGLGAAVAKYFDRAIEAQVKFDKRGQFFLSDIAVHVGRGIVAHASAEADDAYLAFSGALEHLAKRLRRHKRRLRDHHNSEGRATKAEKAWQYILAGPGDEEPQEDTPTDGSGGAKPLVVAEMEAEIPTLSVDEAVMRLDLGEAPALMFRNAGSGDLNMIYRRSDGHIGWVDPGTRKPTRA
ncbi:MAG: ribosome-associated translation inhibitor RaiA [Rhodospirillaceae bacterium]|nr:ribosome-associated translation inhibitor RaiA [Rhodospirillaceae bacterium]